MGVMERYGTKTAGPIIRDPGGMLLDGHMGSRPRNGSPYVLKSR